MEPEEQPIVESSQLQQSETSDYLIKEGDTVMIYMGINNMKM